MLHDTPLRFFGFYFQEKIIKEILSLLMPYKQTMKITALALLSVFCLIDFSVAQTPAKRYHVEFKLKTSHPYDQLGPKIDEWIQGLGISGKVVSVSILPNPSS